MKTTFKFYAAAWALVVAFFNLFVFAMPFGHTLHDGVFWACYICIMLLFVGQGVCSFFYTRQSNAAKRFLNIPIMTLSYSALFAGFAVGSACMKITFMPLWLAVVLCAAVTVFYAVAVLQALAAAAYIDNVGQTVRAKTFFIRSLAADAEALTASATPETGAALRRVAEAIRYSDPMSSDALAETESQITVLFEQLSASAKEKDADKVNAFADEMLALLKSRNAKCKMLK